MEELIQAMRKKTFTQTVRLQLKFHSAQYQQPVHVFCAWFDLFIFFFLIAITKQKF